VTSLALTHGRIWTGNPAQSWAAVASVAEGRFVDIGRAAPAGDTRAIDLDGRLVVPGFWDAHAHLAYTGMAMAQVQLKGARSIAEVQRLVRDRVEASAPDAWVEGAGWDQNDWPDPRFPSRHDLDLVSPRNPVVLVHTSGHCSWVNSAALRAANIDAQTGSPEGGAIPPGDDGLPAGILFDRAMDLVSAAIPSRGPGYRTDAILRAAAHAHSLGIVGVHAMDVGPGELAALRALHGGGRLRLRVRAFLSARDESLWDGMRTGDGDEWLRIGGVKWFADGALGSLTAWMEEPYEHEGGRGFPLQPVDELEAAVRRALAAGLAPAIHAIGDRANREVLDLLERVAALAPELPRRIEHAQLLGSGMARRFAGLAVTASVQPIHATQDMAKVDREWGARGRYAYPFRSLLAAGVNLAFGSDTPVETMDPLAGLRAAVNRQRDDGHPPGGWYPSERLTVEQALAAYTSDAATAVREPLAGRIASGYAADCVILSHNFVEDPALLSAAMVDMTVIGGEVVYAREGTPFEQHAAAAAGVDA
jgi:hypothetical protein